MRFKKSLALLLALLMLLGMLPMAALAEGDSATLTINNESYASFEAAVEANALVENADIVIGSGEIEVPSTTVFPNGTTIQGAGKDATTLKITTTNGDGIKITNPNFTLKDLTVDGSEITSGGYKSLINVEADGARIENVIMTGGGESTWNSSILVETLPATATFTVKDSTISGAFRGVLRESCDANIVIDGCDITATYPFNIDGGNSEQGYQGFVKVSDSKLHGWSSYSAVKYVLFENTEFTKGDYDIVAAYVDTTFKKCTFDADFDAYAQTSPFTWTFIDCTKNGDLLTKDNFQSQFTDSDVWTKCTLIVNDSIYNNNDGTWLDPVAKIEDTNYYTLAAAIAEAESGATITLVADDYSLANGGEIEITKPLTITGAVDESTGEPLYTIYGKSDANPAEYHDIFIKSTTGTVTLSNLKIAEFCNESNSAIGHTPILVSTSNNNVVLDNLYISAINCGGVHINGGTFTINDCYIDCAKTAGTVYTKGIEIVNAATGTITDTTIVNVTGAANCGTGGIEASGSGDVTVSGCEITGTNAYAYGIATSTNEGNTHGSSKVTVSDCTITTTDGAALYNDSDKGAVISVDSGTYSGMLSSTEAEDGIAISGGKYNDDPADYVVEGYASVQSGEWYYVGVKAAEDESGAATAVIVPETNDQGETTGYDVYGEDGAGEIVLANIDNVDLTDAVSIVNKIAYAVENDADFTAADLGASTTYAVEIAAAPQETALPQGIPDNMPCFKLNPVLKVTNSGNTVTVPLDDDEVKDNTSTPAAWYEVEVNLGTDDYANKTVAFVHYDNNGVAGDTYYATADNTGKVTLSIPHCSYLSLVVSNSAGVEDDSNIESIVVKAGGVTVTPNSSGNYDIPGGAAVEMTITAYSGYRVKTSDVAVKSPDDSTTYASTCVLNGGTTRIYTLTFTMPTTGNVKVKIPTYGAGYAITYGVSPDATAGTVTIKDAGGNEITEAGTGDKVFVTATPATGYVPAATPIAVEDSSHHNPVALAADNSFTMPAGGAKVTAYFVAKDSAELGFVMDGGTIEHPENYGTNWKLNLSKNYVYSGLYQNEEFTVPTPVKEGYTFDGWYENSGLTGTAIAAETKITIPAAASTLYFAKWTANTFTIHYDAGDGSGQHEDVTVEYNSGTKAATKDEVGFVYTGHGVDYWLVQGTTSPLYTPGTSDVSKLVSTQGGEVTLVAKWYSNKQTVTYYRVEPDIASDAETKVVEVSYGGDHPVLSWDETGMTVDPVYTFNGWNTKADGTGDPVTGTITKVQKDYVLYAQWTTPSYSITCDPATNVTSDPAGTAKYNTDVKLSYTIPDGSNLSAFYYYVGSDTAHTWALTNDQVIKMPAGNVTVKAEFTAGVAKIGTTVYGKLADAIDNAGASDTIELLADIDLVKGVETSTGYETIEKPITIDMSGHTIKVKPDVKLAFVVKENGNLTLLGTGTVTRAVDANATTDKGGLIQIRTGGSVTLGKSGASGVITLSGGTTPKYGGAVSVSTQASFTMYGGTITGNSAGENGGAVYVDAGGEFHMAGGAITGNTATGNGGGVYLAPKDGTTHAKFEMSGDAYITGNDATLGGGVYVSELNDFRVEGNVKIADNTSGGNVYMLNASSLAVYELGADAKIGVTIAGSDGTGVATTGGKAGNKLASFTSDNESLVVRKTTANEIELLAPKEIIVNKTNCDVTVEVNDEKSVYAVSGDTVKLKITFEPGYVFDQITKPGNVLDDDWHMTTEGVEYWFKMPDGNATVTVKYKPITYTVKLDPNAAKVLTTITPVSLPDITATYNETYTLDKDVKYSAPSYTFKGWDTNKDADPAAVTYAVGTDVSILNWLDASGTVTLYAIWQAGTYNVAFDDGTTVISEGKNYGETVDKPATAPTKTGYNFKYWYTTDEATQVNWPYTVTNDVTFTAKWTPITYTVAFHPNGGTGNTYNLSVDYESTVTAVALDVTGIAKEGSTLMYWTKTPADSGTQYKPGVTRIDTLSTTAGDIVDLYAQWSNSTYTVTYHQNNGGDATYAVDSLAYESEYEVKAYSTIETAGTWPAADTTKFARWDTEPAGTGLPYAPGAKLTVKGNTDLYAVWNDTTYTVTFDTNGGTPATIDSQTVVAGGYATDPDAPTKSNYVFQGWYTDKDTWANKWTFASSVVNANVKLFAYYVGADVTVNFHDHKTTDNVTTKTWKYGEAPIMPESPTWSGHSFDGWYTAANASGSAVTEIILKDYAAGVYNLHAHWSTGSYTITALPSANVTATPGTANAGDSVTLEITIPEGKQISGITFTKTDGTALSDTIAYTLAYDVAVSPNAATFTMVAENIKATVAFEDVGYKLTNAAMEHGTVTYTPDTYAAGAVVTLTIEPDPGYVLEGNSLYVQADGSSTHIIPSSSNQFDMPAANAVVYAKFLPLNYTIGYADFTGKHGTVTGAGTAFTDESVALTVTPDAGYSANVKVTKTGETAVVVAEGNINSFTMPAYAVTVDAVFTAGAYNISADSSITNGKVYIGASGTAIFGTAATDDIVTLQVLPDAGYEIDTVSYKYGSTTVSIVASSGVYTVTMPAADVTVTATFKAIPYSVYVTNTGSGAVTVAKESPWTVGDTVNLKFNAGETVLTDLYAVYTIAPDTLYAINHDTTAASFTMPAADVNVYAVFTDAVAVNVNTGVYYISLDAAKAEVQGDQTIKLLADATGNYAFGAITLDLNGHNLVGTADSTPVIKVSTTGGAFTLTDSTGGGKVYSTGEDAIGVEVPTGSNLKLYGGEISNTATGVLVADEANIYVKGTPVVQNNTVNVQLNGNAMVRFDGALTDGAKIGVNKNLGIFTVGYAYGNTHDAQPSVYFTSDSSAFSVVLDGTEASLNNQYQITLTAVNDLGKLTVDGETNNVYAKPNDTVKVDIEPKPGYAIDSIKVTKTGETHVDYQKTWNDTDTSTSYEFSMMAYPVTVEVTFKTIGYQVIADYVVGGDVKVNPMSAVVDQKIDVTLTPDAGYELVDGSVYFIRSDTSEKTYFTEDYFYMVASDVTVTAAFQLKEYDIYAVASDANVEPIITVNGTVADKAKMGDNIVITTTLKGDSKLAHIVVVYVDDDGNPQTLDEADITTVYNDDNTFQSASFTMPAGDTCAIAFCDDQPTIDQMLKNAAVYNIGADYTGAILPKDDTAKYYIQKTVAGTDDANVIADLNNYLNAIGKLGGMQIVYNKTAYTYNDATGKWTDGTNQISLNTSKDIKLAINGVPVTIEIIRQENLLAGNPVLKTGGTVAIVEDYATADDVALLKSLLSNVLVGGYDNYEVAEKSCIVFTLYRNNVKVTPDSDAVLKEAVKLLIPYEGASSGSSLLPAYIHAGEPHINETAGTYGNQVGGVWTMASEFSVYGAIKPKEAEIEYEATKGVEFVDYVTSAPYGNPFSFKVKVTDGYKIKSVSYNNYDITADAYDLGNDTYQFSFIPKDGNYKVKATSTATVTYYRNKDASDIYTVEEDAAIGENYPIASGEPLAPGKAYKFAGWSTERSGGVSQTYIPGENVVLDAPLTLYAQWTIIDTYYVIFNDAVDGTAAMSVTIAEPGTQNFQYVADGLYKVADPIADNEPLDANTQIPTFRRSSYSFDGWYLDNTGAYEYKFDLTKSLAENNFTNFRTKIADNVYTVTLYAKWVATPQSVSIETTKLPTATASVFYSGKIKAVADVAPIGGGTPAQVYSYFFLVNSNGVFTSVPELPKGLFLNQKNGEVYGVPQEIPDGGTATVYVRVFDEAGNPISPVQPISIDVKELTLGVDYDGTAAGKTFGEKDDPKDFTTSKLKNITLTTNSGTVTIDKTNGAVIDNYTTVYAVTSDASKELKLNFTYKRDLVFNYDDPYTYEDPVATNKPATADTHTFTVNTHRTPGENADTYKVYLLASDVTVTGGDGAFYTAAAPAADFQKTDVTSGYDFVISQKDISLTDYKVDPDVAGRTYTGDVVTPYVIVKDTLDVNPLTGEETQTIITLTDITPDKTGTGSLYYRIADDSSIDAGINAGKIYIYGVGNYKGVAEKLFDIEKKPLDGDGFEIEVPHVPYNRQPHYEANITVKYNGKPLTYSSTAGAGDYYYVSGDAFHGLNIYVTDNDVLPGTAGTGNWVTIAAHDNTNFSGSRIVKIVIDPIMLSAVWTGNVTRVYDGKDTAPVVNGFTGGIIDPDIVKATGYTYYKLDGDVETKLDAAPSNASSYRVYVTGFSNGNYSVATSGNPYFDYSITPKAATIIWAETNAANAYELSGDTWTYTYGTKPAIQATIAELVSGDSVETRYYTASHDTVSAWPVGSYTAEAYIITGDAGNYTVTGSKSQNIVIKPSPITITLGDAYVTYPDTIDLTTLTYTITGDVIAPTKITVVPNTAGGQPAVYPITCTYTIEPDAENYTVTIVEGKYTVYKAEPDVTAPQAITGLKANGSAQNLITAGTVNKGGDMVYKVDGGSFSTDLPKGTDAKTYTITWKVEENEYYKGTAEKSFTVTIGPKDDSGSGGGTGGGGTGGGGIGGSTKTVELHLLTETGRGTIEFNTPSTIKVNPSTEEKEFVTTSISGGTVVKLEVKPGANYKIEAVTYTINDEKTATAMTLGSDGFYTFKDGKLPDATKVIVKASFKPINENDPSVGRVTIENYTNGYVDCDHTDDSCPLAYFEDLKDNLDAWYHDGIHYCLENGIMQGFGTPYFLPNNLTTRAQVVTVLWNIAGHPIAKSPIAFDDVNEDDWFYDAIMWAAANGIVEGYGDGTFGPNDLITHEQIAKILYGYAKFYGFDVSAKADISNMAGVEKISNWAYQYIEWAVGAGVCCGQEGNNSVVAAIENCTRAELATMILNFCTKVPVLVNAK